MLPKSDDSWTLFEAAHLLSRAGFGGSPDEIRAFHALGRFKAVDSLVSPAEPADASPLPVWANEQRALADMREQIRQRREIRQKMVGLAPEEADQMRRQLFQSMQKENRQQALEGQAWWFRRMLQTNAPLREKMTLFWHDHFATSIQKVREPSVMLKQNELFRSHAFGSFKELTKAMLIDPAMMMYLDTQNSRKGNPNENFAREVMELFTLGEGNYSERDVSEAARAFTGYQIDRFSGVVTHRARQWDEGDKTILGKTAAFSGNDVIDLIFEQAAAAPFMARKIWSFFVHDSLPDSAAEALAAVLRKADYQMAPLLREIFLSREFYSEASVRSQIKSPLQFLIQLLKQLEISEPPAGFAITAQQQLGQVLFMPPNVAGWDWGQAWINTNTLLTRYNLAGFLTKGAEDGGKAMEMERVKTPGMAPAPRRAGRGWNGPEYEIIAPRPLRENPAELVDALIFRFFQGNVPEIARASFIEYAIAKKGVIFTDKETAELCHLMLSTPYYQLC